MLSWFRMPKQLNGTPGKKPPAKRASEPAGALSSS